jgi:hypothetical protein
LEKEGLAVPESLPLGLPLGLALPLLSPPALLLLLLLPMLAATPLPSCSRRALRRLRAAPAAQGSRCPCC